MKLTVSRQELLGRLSNIQNIVEKRNTMPVLSHFLLEAKKAGSRITATDIETAIREPLDASVASEGTLCIPARKLFEIVRELDGDVVIQSEDSQWIKVSAAKSSFRLACLSPEEFPAWPTLEEAVTVGMEPAMLAKLIERTLYSAGESDTRYTINGLLFNMVDTALTVVGTDGHRLALMTATVKGEQKGELKIIVPRKTAQEVKKFLDAEGDVQITIGTNHVLFKINDVEFLARLIEGNYPNYTQVIPVGNDRMVLTNREAAVRALKRVSVMSRERSNAIRVDLDKGTLVLTSSNPDIGEAKDEIQVDYAGDALSIGFNARYLLDVLQAMSSETVCLELRDQYSSVLVREQGDESYKCVVMPMRI